MEIKYNNDFKSKVDINIFGIYKSKNDEMLYKKAKKNILICIENLNNKRFKHYTHYNKYGEYGNPNIHLYIYNHISKIKKTNKFVAIPLIYFRIDYFLFKYNYYLNYPTLNTPYKNKKFCLMINKSGINKNIDTYVKELSKIGKVDNINIHNSKIKNKSCYNSIELLEVFNTYKFILCVENSNQDGYITEKIFNVFFSKSIPIYSGAPNIYKFIDSKSFINITNTITNSSNIIKKLNTDEILYNSYINNHKINPNFNNENYKNFL